MTLDEAKEILESAGYVLDEGIISRALGAGALAAGLAFGNSGIKEKPVRDDSFGKGSVVHMQTRYNMDSDRYGVPTSYKVKGKKPGTEYSLRDEIELTKQKILATPDSMLRKYGKENVGLIAKHMVNTANKYNIDVDILLAIAGTETNFDNNRVSGAGAHGMMQITKSTGKDIHTRLSGKPAKKFDFSDYKSLRNNIDAAGRLVADLSKRRANVIEMILATYNGGQTAATGWRAYKANSKYDRNGNIAPKLPKETKDYVDRCMALYKVYKKVQNEYNQKI